MKKGFLAVLVAASLSACTSVQNAPVSAADVAVNGEAVAVIQGDALGISAILYLVDIVKADLDTAVNQLVVKEAKSMGASKVELTQAYTTPRQGIFALTGLILGFPYAHAVGVAIK